MKQIKTPPTMFLFAPNRKTGICSITHSYEHSVDYHFPSASEMSFKVQKNIYDIDSERWIENPCYSKIQKKLLICTNDNNDIFRFKGDTLYSRYDDVTFNDRQPDHPSYDFRLGAGSYWGIQRETELFDIGSTSGYTWSVGSYIDSKTGEFVDLSDKISEHYQQIACKEFIPVSNGDIVSYILMTDGKLDFGYEILYYAKADASTFLKSSGHIGGNPLGRHCIEFPNGYTDGYIRFSLASYKSKPEHIWYPNYGYIKIYSGEQHCNYVITETSNDVCLPLRWWVITDIQEVSDKINSTKTVSLRSYEYVLSDKTFSLQGGTLPLYLPPSIPSLVNSDNWVYDKVDGISYYHAQHMKTGIINQILERIPNWSIGYISRGLLAPMKYRTFESVDNANIFSFLTNEIQSKFNCFVIFDLENRKINFISKKDVCDIHSPTVLTWENAIKQFNITTNDTQMVTAMRIHTGNDEYGIGLVNPTGNSTIYNFSSMEKYMNYVADSENTTQQRLLSTAVTDILAKTSMNTATYRNYAQKLIQLNMDIVKLTTKLSEKLTEYRTVADQINISLQADYAGNTSGVPEGYILSDAPRTVESMRTGKYKPVNNYSNYSTQALHSKILDASQAYYGVKSQLQSKQSEYNSTYNSMKAIANSVSLTKEGYLSKNEVKELDNFIFEGDWSNPNAIFKDTYSSSDIYDTLVSVYNDAQEDLDNIYSKPTYEFEVTSANILAIPEMEENIQNIYLGNNLLMSSPTGFINPVLLSIHINYDDLTDFSMSFSTDYKRKPIQLRFSDLFGTINQISVETPSFTFDS